MDDSQREISNDSSVGPSQLSEETMELHSEQHITSVPVRGAGVVRGTDRVDRFTFSFHWTVRFKRTEMTKRDASILLKVLMVEWLQIGMDFTGYIAAEFVTSYLQGSHLPEEIYDEKDRQAVMLGNLILASFRGRWITLGTREKLPPQLVKEIQDLEWLPNQRTWNSWKQYHNAKSFLEILAVPLDTYNNDDERFGTRYSSYTKHYGNGGHVSPRLKTLYDSDLDGESTDRKPPGYNLLEIDRYNRILWLLEKAKMERLHETK